MKKLSYYGMITQSIKRKCLKQQILKIAPWHIIDANKKSTARLQAISHILEKIPYQNPKNKRVS